MFEGVVEVVCGLKNENEVYIEVFELLKFDIVEFVVRLFMKEFFEKNL